MKIEWDKNEQEVTSSLSNGGRGMELSELTVFNGNLFTADDRTGVIYKLSQSKKGNWKVYPWVILADGNGEETKGFKCEWMTVKNQHLYVGGLGKEWTDSSGNVINYVSFLFSLTKDVILSNKSCFKESHVCQTNKYKRRG